MGVTECYKILKSNWALKKLTGDERFYLESSLFSSAIKIEMVLILFHNRLSSSTGTSRVLSGSLCLTAGVVALLSIRTSETSGANS